jgi:hypothetical protein
MSTLRLAVDPARVRFEQSAGGSVVCLDFQSLAGLIDAVAAAEPVRLATLLPIIWETSYKMEARTVLQAAVACRDPLADLGTICRDALRTLTDLEKLARARQWRNLAGIVGHTDPRACALLNACDHEIARLTGPKQDCLKGIRPQLEVAAQAERKARGQEIRAIAGLRQARCPGIWELYETWHDTE